MSGLPTTLEQIEERAYEFARGQMQCHHALVAERERNDDLRHSRDILAHDLDLSQKALALVTSERDHYRAQSAALTAELEATRENMRANLARMDKRHQTAMLEPYRGVRPLDGLALTNGVAHFDGPDDDGAPVPGFLREGPLNS
jgi:hypothetical protein